MEVDGLNGQNLDMRLKHCMLTDTTLQAELSGEEFRAWCNLTTWVVSNLSDGAFSPGQAVLLVPHVQHPQIMRFIELGLVECDDDGNCRIAPIYWRWQSTREELQRLRDRKRQGNVRSVSEAARAIVTVANVPHGSKTEAGMAVQKLLDAGHDTGVVTNALQRWVDSGTDAPELSEAFAAEAPFN
jgi:hypothetical protein